MNPDHIDLARRAVASPKWRWMPGMLWSIGPEPGWVRANTGRVLSTYEDGGPVCAPRSCLPDLTDPATLGCMLDIVRQIHGRSTVIRLVGTNGQGGEEWAICDRAPGGMAAPSIYGFGSELEALVAALEAAP